MNELRTLLEEFWICRDADKEEYYRVRRDVPNFQKFVREQLGWKLIHTENLIKLEKVPAHAEGFMGIQEFTVMTFTGCLSRRYISGSSLMLQSLKSFP